METAVITVEDMRGGYTQIARTVMTQGSKVQSRLGPTLELIAPTLVLQDPTDALPVGVGRNLVLRIAAVEALQLLAARSAYGLVTAASSNFRESQEPDGTFWGNYGDRIGFQFHAVFERLNVDRDSRQGVITLWRPELDLMTDNKRDYPCTVGFQFLIRDDQLVMITTMRSNDVWKGLAYDVFQFTQLQIHLAACLGVPVGPYIHRPGSLHVYEENYDQVLALSEYPTRGPIEEVQSAMCQGFCPPDALTRYARDVLEGRPRSSYSPSARWYVDQLAKLR